MITVTGTSKSFGDKQLLDDINFSLDNEVVGLIGNNGSGKTTILKILSGELLSDKGNIQKGDEVIHYLPQYPDFKELTVRDFLTSKLVNPSDNYKIEIALQSLGLSKIDKNQPANSLSGGQKTKLHLASLLLTNSTTLLLDEPTNNLDMHGLIWLEKFIKDFKGNILLVSHDRALLDNTVDRIIELKDGKIKKYGGNYSFYREQKLAEEKSQLEKYKENTEEVARLEKLISDKKERARRLSKDTKPTRDNDKFAANFFSQRSIKIDRQAKAVESRLGHLEKLEKPKERISFPFGFEGQVHSDKFILGCKNISKNYNDKVVLQDISFSISGNQHIWLSGTNGSGKTTLLNILAKKLQPDKGNIEIGNNVKIGYFSQETSQLDINKTGIEELILTGTSETDCFKYAMNLHLNPSDLRKPISQLSRGQIAKLEFIKLLIGKNHILILDEPTNHLEVETREEIEEALKNYQGAILVISHDRYFLEEIGISKSYELKAGKLN
ncbi:MAG: ABC-F type ribosomal protection protein [Candidatus Daviesbacteria bacterium]|nr:ABC-F type ribosomal protection protein [Candidatus Daviesbacteria bacterium]